MEGYMTGYRIGVDVGGTYVKIALVDANGETGNVDKTIGNRIINVSGAPIIGNQDGSSGIRIDTFTNKKIIYTMHNITRHEKVKLIHSASL